MAHAHGKHTHTLGTRPEDGLTLVLRLHVLDDLRVGGVDERRMHDEPLHVRDLLVLLARALRVLLILLLRVVVVPLVQRWLRRRVLERAPVLRRPDRLAAQNYDPEYGTSIQVCLRVLYCSVQLSNGKLIQRCT